MEERWKDRCELPEIGGGGGWGEKSLLIAELLRECRSVMFKTLAKCVCSSQSILKLDFAVIFLQFLKAVNTLWCRNSVKLCEMTEQPNLI